ncbi:MAG: GtrA family protein [Spirochaetaceae bacterium]|jgi:putative flippase GtrA|nr:GtrA family protein [Spirochaetaceae bacterium]
MIDMMSGLRIFDKQFLKFILVGAINTLVGAAIMFSLYNVAHASYWFSSACTYFFTSILSFFLNKYFTFQVKTWSARQVVAFVATIAVSYLAAYGIAKPVVNYILQNSGQPIRENAALLVGMCFFTGLNYLGQRLVVFRRV